jgi:tetratricopeptide (TPR) repeat protein
MCRDKENDLGCEKNMKNNFSKSILILVLFFPSVAFSATVTLKSGKKVEGKIIEETDQYVKIELDGAPLYYEKKYIESIIRDKETAVAAEGAYEVKDAKFYLKEGLKLSAQGKFAEAEAMVKKGLEIDAEDHNLQEVMKMLTDLNNGAMSKVYADHLFKGSDSLINADYQQAFTEFQEALKLKPEDADLNYYLGVCNFFLAKYPEAITYFKQAEGLRPNDSEIHYYLGISNYSIGQFQDAIKYLEKTLASNPNDAETYAIIGTAQYLSGQGELAKENLNKAKELFQKKGDYPKVKDLEELLSKIKM